MISLRRTIAVSLFLAALALNMAPVLGDQAVDAAEVAAPTIELRGDRAWRFDFAPVYHRFDRLAVHVHGIEANGTQRMRVTLKRQPPVGEATRKLVVMQGRLEHLRTDNVHHAHHADAATSVRGHVQLGEPQRRLPVGRYHVQVSIESEDGAGDYQPVAKKPMFIIFNAWHWADHEVHKAEPEQWLASGMDLVQIVGGQLSVEAWDLDIHDPEVFELAMSLADGAYTGSEAAERLVAGACAHVQGNWPRLPNTDGFIPENNPDPDPDWQASSVTSAAERLASDDKRGQCFDYAMLYVALLRSVGVPARAVTAVSPAPMPHPDDPSTQVQWDYHVWAEVHLEERWWASDVTYLDPPLRRRLPAHVYPGLQKPHDRWFAQMVGPRTRLWMVEHGQLRDVGEHYGVLVINETARLARAFGLQ